VQLGFLAKTEEFPKKRKVLLFYSYKVPISSIEYAKVDKNLF